MANATDPTRPAAPVSTPVSLAGTDRPALPTAPAGSALALVAEAMVELGIDANDEGPTFESMLAAPYLTTAIIFARDYADLRDRDARRASRAARLYSCNL